MDGVDPAFVPLLADRRMALRPPPPSLNIDDFRAAADGFLARVRGPDLASVKDLGVERTGLRLRLRLYRPTDGESLPVILFVHGGGFVFGSLATHDAMCRRLAWSSGAAVLAIDYRLAPEHPHPAADEDLDAALRWLGTADIGLDAARLALAGDSAGGYLALGAALRHPGLTHLALIYPVVDPLRRSRTARDFAEGYMLTGDFLDWSWRCYAGVTPLDDPRLDPSEQNLTLLPPTTIVTAEYDPLRDEGEALAARMREAGVPIDCRRYPGMIHGFAGLPNHTPAADEAIEYVGGRIAEAFAG